MSERHACCVLELARATHRYEGRQEQWLELRMRIREIAQTRVRYGYRMIRILLGNGQNHTLTIRLHSRLLCWRL